MAVDSRAWFSPVRRPLAQLAAGAAVFAALSAVAGSQAVGASNTAVQITERDFQITAPRKLAAGEIVFQVHNRGPDAHEFLIVRSNTAQLPLRTDGLTANEEALQRSEPGHLEPGQPGAVRELRVQLTPGRYVLFCNMSGHYLGGMHAVLVVR